MKFLSVIFTLLISLAAMAQSEYRVEFNDLDIKKVAKTQNDKLNTLYSNVDTYCDGTGHHADLITECKKVKATIAGIYLERMNKHIEKELRDAIASEKLAQQKLLCIADLRKKLTSIGAAFTQDDTCIQLKSKYCIALYSKYLTDKGQAITGSTCAEIKAQWFAYQESIQ